MKWSSPSGRMALNLTKAQAATVSHPGDCYLDVCALLRDSRIRRQTAKLDSELLKAELREVGAWDESELTDREANMRRLVWMAGCDIADACDIAGVGEVVYIRGVKMGSE